MSGRPIDTGTDTVLAEIVDGVGVVTLNRPERRNALNRDVFAFRERSSSSWSTTRWGAS
jgi:hypothetical protein